MNENTDSIIKGKQRVNTRKNSCVEQVIVFTLLAIIIMAGITIIFEPYLNNLLYNAMGIVPH